MVKPNADLSEIILHARYNVCICSYGESITNYPPGIERQIIGSSMSNRIVTCRKIMGKSETTPEDSET